MARHKHRHNYVLVKDDGKFEYYKCSCGSKQRINKRAVGRLCH